MQEIEKAGYQEIVDGVNEAWDALTNAQRKYLTRRWEEILTSAENNGEDVCRMDVVRAIIDYISTCGLETIGKPSTVENIRNMPYEDFRTIIED